MTTEILEILDKLEFFQGQRAGLELWLDKPEEVQEKDLENFNRDIQKIREFVLNVQKSAEDVLERLEEERQKMRDESDRFSTLYLDNFESDDPMKAVAESVIVCEQKSFAFGEAIEIVKEGLK